MTPLPDADRCGGTRGPADGGERLDPETPARDTTDIRRVVLKLGTNTLCDPNGRPDVELLRSVAAEIHQLRATGKQFLVVSSGAVGSGLSLLRGQEPHEVPLRQAYSALGQHRLMQAWDEAMARHKIHAAQVLLTHGTFEERRRYLNIRNCVESLLGLPAVPVLNANDAECTAEIDEAQGDNDRLGTLLASRIGADLYVMLSDVPCLYTKPPHARGARPVPYVQGVDNKVLRMVPEATGMRSKLLSAQRLTADGIPAVVAYGREPGVLSRILAGEEVGTWFDPPVRRSPGADGHRAWLTAAKPAGSILVDAGAAEALRGGNQLLPAGVRGVEGRFPVESVVEIRVGDEPVARAVSQLSSRELEVCRGLQSEDARRRLGLDAAVHVTRKGRMALMA